MQFRILNLPWAHRARVEPMARVAATAVPKHLPGLDAVRALAALAVLACHAIQATTVWSPRWMSSGGSPWATPLRSAMEEAGAWGVGIFFVLSGLCIHLPLARKVALGALPEIEPAAYFRRRFRRIYPPHLIALALSAVLATALPLGHFGVHPMISAPTFKQLAAHFLMVHTFVPSAFYSINHVLWTIAVEAHFYLLYPLLLAARRRVGVGTLCVVLLGLSLALRASGRLFAFDDATRLILEKNFPGRFWEWTLGCWLAERIVNRGVEMTPKLRTLLVGLFATYLIALGIRHLLPYGSLWSATLLPPLFALSIAGACGIAAKPGALLVRIGKASYSLYLVHPIALSLALVTLRAAGVTSARLELAIAVPFAFATTFAFFRCVEQHYLAAAVARPAPAVQGVTAV
ncbi:MAG: acyltransferase [Deltaproteobacteria bacterium]|nr:MAG: acyltransferase [Deltaproteobacteria bacterium]